MSNKIVVMPSKRTSRYFEKFSHLENVINDLYKEDKYLLSVFLLRSQLIEFSLKYLLLNYPFKIDNFSEVEIEKMTIGQVVRKIKELDDFYMKDILKNASKFVNFRNKMIHNFIKSNMDMSEINKNIKRNMRYADLLEENIFYYFDFVEKEIYSL